MIDAGVGGNTGESKQRGIRVGVRTRKAHQRFLSSFGWGGSFKENHVVFLGESDSLIRSKRVVGPFLKETPFNSDLLRVKKLTLIRKLSYVFHSVVGVSNCNERNSYLNSQVQNDPSISFCGTPFVSYS